MESRYVQTDRWTTQDGEWFVSDKPYSIDQYHLDKWGNEPIEGKGCAICCFVKLVGGPGTKVRYTTTAGLVLVHPIDGARWAHNEMANPGSGYNPNDNVGPWNVRSDDAPSDIVDDIGLPGGNHVTTFVEMTWEEDASGPTPPDPEPEPGPGPDEITVQVKVGSTLYGGTLAKIGQVPQDNGA